MMLIIVQYGGTKCHTGAVGRIKKILHDIWAIRFLEITLIEKRIIESIINQNGPTKSIPKSARDTPLLYPYHQKIGSSI